MQTRAYRHIWSEWVLFLPYSPIETEGTRWGGDGRYMGRSGGLARGSGETYGEHMGGSGEVTTYGGGVWSHRGFGASSRSAGVADSTRCTISIYRRCGFQII